MLAGVQARQRHDRTVGKFKGIMVSTREV